MEVIISAQVVKSYNQPISSKLAGFIYIII
jgi:hypothetical protein